MAETDEAEKDRKSEMKTEQKEKSILKQKKKPPGITKYAAQVEYEGYQSRQVHSGAEQPKIGT